MKSAIFLRSIAALILLSGIAAAQETPAAAQKQPQTSGNIYAQALVDRVLAQHHEIIALAIYTTSPNTNENTIVASNSGQIGQKASQSDLNVIQTGQPRTEVGKSGDRFETKLPLHDVSGDTVGELAVVFPYKNGNDKAKLLKTAEQVRDELGRRISHAGNLLDPYPYDSHTPTNTYAQKLVDETLAKYPEVIILALHVSLPNSSDNVILGSNIGRIGKKADEDDQRLIDTGKPNLEVNTTGKRFEVELRLLDQPGETIGAVGVVFAYKAGDDKSSLQKRAEQIRDELQKKIPAAAKLLEPAQ